MFYTNIIPNPLKTINNTAIPDDMYPYLQNFYLKLLTSEREV